MRVGRPVPSEALAAVLESAARLQTLEAGVRQMIRTRPLETVELTLPSGRVLRAPTADETLCIKGFLVVRRNQTRDYLDVAALADRHGLDHAGEVLADIDHFYADQRGDSDGVASQLVRQLADPRPADRSATAELASYRNLEQRWCGGRTFATSAAALQRA